MATIVILQEAHQDTLNGMNACGSRLFKDSLVLDFGVGWGRISRFFLRETRLKNIYGIDVDPDFVALCRGLFGTENFHVCAPMPPTSLKEGTFSLITAYSVYSHLSGEACLGWLAEFRRLLKPGGCFAFTTRHESFFDYLEHMRDKPENVEAYSRALGELFPDLAVVRQRYAQGELVHASSLGVSGGGVRNESFYGETFIPEEYVRAYFTDGFELVSHSFSRGRYDQMFYLLQKK